MEKSLGKILEEWLISLGITGQYAFWIKNIAVFTGIVILSILVNYIAKKIILNVLKKVTQRTKSNWDDILYERGVFTRLSHLAPAIVIYQLGPIALKSFPQWIPVVIAGVKIYMILIFLLVIDALLSGLNEIYNSYEISKNKPIKGLVQAVKIIFYLIGGIFIISVLINKSPVYLLGGLGALSAILLLIFKDTILGFVASIQLSGNNMVKPGDWITMSKYGADGIVKEITLFSVKVENFDKTMTMIPTYNMVIDSFQNWRNMEESGVRRLIRNLSIDLTTIVLLNDKRKEEIMLQVFTPEQIKSIETKEIQSNLELFKIYVELLLKAHPQISKEQTLLVRTLEPTEKGIPLQIYCFVNTTVWAEVERVQFEIINNLLLNLPKFDLKLFQNKSATS